MQLQPQSKLVPVHNLKAYRRSRGTAPHIRNVGSRGRWVISFTTRQVLPHIECSTHWIGEENHLLSHWRKLQLYILIISLDSPNCSSSTRVSIHRFTGLAVCLWNALTSLNTLQDLLVSYLWLFNDAVISAEAKRLQQPSAGSRRQASSLLHPSLWPYSDNRYFFRLSAYIFSLKMVCH